MVDRIEDLGQYLQTVSQRGDGGNRKLCERENTMRSLMDVNGLQIGVHHPVKDPSRGSRLAPAAEWPVYNVAEYDDGRLPEAWERGGPSKGAFFVGTHSERELCSTSVR